MLRACADENKIATLIPTPIRNDLCRERIVGGCNVVDWVMIYLVDFGLLQANARVLVCWLRCLSFWSTWVAFEVGCSGWIFFSSRHVLDLPFYAQRGDIDLSLCSCSHLDSGFNLNYYDTIPTYNLSSIWFRNISVTLRYGRVEPGEGRSRCT